LRFAAFRSTQQGKLESFTSPGYDYINSTRTLQPHQEAGVKYYCIVDPETRSAEVYELQDGAYGKKDDFKDGKIHFDLDPCAIDFDFSEIFQE
jgi:Uma2 family endonuclease